MAAVEMQGYSYQYRLKIDFPVNAAKNLVGLLLGPKGQYQKKLEEESGCKILVRGQPAPTSSSQPLPVSLSGEDAPHVVVMSNDRSRLPYA